MDEQNPLPHRFRMLIWRVGSIILAAWGRVWMRLFRCTVAPSAKIYGRSSLLCNWGRIAIGERVTLWNIPSIYEYGMEFRRCHFVTSPQGRIEVGEDSTIAGSVICAQNAVTIGKRVLIAAGCRISDTHFHTVDAVPRFNTKEAKGDPIIIEDDVWLCAETIIMPGVRIGRGSVIGARSVVTADVPPMVLAAGIPTRIIRSLNCTDTASPQGPVAAPGGTR